MSTSGSFWLRYYEESQQKLLGLAPKVPRCEDPGCREPAMPRSGKGHARYCVEHAGDEGLRRRRAEEARRRERKALLREQRGRHDPPPGGGP